MVASLQLMVKPAAGTGEEAVILFFNAGRTKRGLPPHAETFKVVGGYPLSTGEEERANNPGRAKGQVLETPNRTV